MKRISSSITNDSVKQGFTLLEVLVAFLILSVVLTLFFQVQITSLSFTSKLNRNDFLECSFTERLACIERNHDQLTNCNLSGVLSTDKTAVNNFSWSLASSFTPIMLGEMEVMTMYNYTLTLIDSKTKKTLSKLLYYPGKTEEDFIGTACEVTNFLTVCPEIKDTCVKQSLVK